MNTSINTQRLVPLFMVCLFIALVPSLFFWYLAALSLLIKIFVVVCLIDYLGKTTIRSHFGLVLIAMFLAAIIATIVVNYLYPLG